MNFSNIDEESSLLPVINNESSREVSAQKPKFSFRAIAAVAVGCLGLIAISTTFTVKRSVPGVLELDANGQSYLCEGQNLSPGSSLYSPNGGVRLAYQYDGNLVIYAPGNSACWASGTNNAGNFIFQNDANAVIYNGGNRAVWSTGTMNAGSNLILKIQNDCNLVMYDNNGNVKWSSNSQRTNYRGWADNNGGFGYCNPTQYPTPAPIANPTPNPIANPTFTPTVVPTVAPVATPTAAPTIPLPQVIQNSYSFQIGSSTYSVTLMSSVTQKTATSTFNLGTNWVYNGNNQLTVTNGDFCGAINAPRTVTIILVPSGQPATETEPKTCNYQIVLPILPGLPTLSPTPSPIANPTAKPIANPTFTPTFAPSPEPIANPTAAPTIPLPQTIGNSFSFTVGNNVYSLSLMSSVTQKTATSTYNLGTYWVYNGNNQFTVTNGDFCGATGNPRVASIILVPSGQPASESEPSTCNYQLVVPLLPGLPTFSPTPNPIANPTANPIANPTFVPTLRPSANPTAAPTVVPTAAPSPNQFIEPGPSSSTSLNAVGTLIYLDRHTIDCNSAPLQSFKGNTANGGTQFQYLYQCGTLDPSVQVSSVTTPSTPQSTVGDGSLANLQNYGLSCPSNGLISKFDLQTFNKDSQYNYAYTCSNYAAQLTCRSASTSWTSEGDGIIYLDRQSVACNYNEGLQSLQLNYNNLNIRYSYTCCSITALPTAAPTLAPTVLPTLKPTPVPSSVAPTLQPTVKPTNAPIANPTFKPTSYPIANPTKEPTPEPTFEPSPSPTLAPTDEPTLSPTTKPTKAPIAAPSFKPTSYPIANPTKEPTPEPTFEPSPSPTLAPTDEPTLSPTFAPTPSPSIDDTVQKEISGGIYGGAPYPTDDGNGPNNQTPSSGSVKNICAGKYVGGTSPSIPSGCGIVSAEDIGTVADGESVDIITICSVAGTPIKLDSSELTSYGMIGNPKPVLGVSTLLANSDSDFQFFSLAGFSGVSSKYSNYPDGALVHKVYPGTKTNANDNVNSLIFSTTATDPVTQSC